MSVTCTALPPIVLLQEFAQVEHTVSAGYNKGSDSQSVSGLQASHPAVKAIQKSLLEALTEVHLRRLDTAELLHRRAVATIAIEATPEEVLRHAH